MNGIEDSDVSSSDDADEAGRALVGTMLAGRYRIEALLGTGGMGVVYRAEHIHMRKAVAVKVLHREMTLYPEVVARFEREAVAAGRIEHPHVASASDFGRLEDGSFYMVLEFVEGHSLNAIIRRDGAFPELKALRVARQIADALAAAHGAGIVHRDLKPDNVMLVEREGTFGTVKVLDFGIAKVQLGSSGEQALTQVGTVFGTPEYMAPEQAQGLPVDARADLYTLGLILYEMLTATSPFRHEELVVVLTRQITVDPPALPPSISEGTRELVTALLKKDPNARVQTAAEVRERLDRLIESVSSSSTQVEALTEPKSSAGSPDPSRGPSDVSATLDATTAERPEQPRALLQSEHEVAHANTALALPTVAKTPLTSLVALARRVGLDRPVAVAGYAVPLGALLGFAVVLVLVGALTTVLVTMSANGGAEGEGAAVAPPPPDIVALARDAERGDVSAIASLVSRPAAKRAIIEWRAIGHGYFVSGDPKSGLAAYAEGVRLKPELAQDPLVLADVRSAVAHPELAMQALELAAQSFGSGGADLLYDVWDEQKSTQSSSTAKRARALLDEEPAKSNRSRALDAALNLQAALKRPKCSELRQLLASISLEADERSVPSLARLSERRGCGFLGLGDCYSCLRANKDLAKALAAAKARPRPTFRAPSPATSGSAAPAPRKPAGASSKPSSR